MQSEQTSSTELEHSLEFNMTNSFACLLGSFIVIIAAVFVLLHAFEFILDVLKNIFKFCEFIWDVLKTIAKFCVCFICVKCMWWLLSLGNAINLGFEEMLWLVALCYTIKSLCSSTQVQRLLFALFCGCILLVSICLAGTNATAKYL